MAYGSGWEIDEPKEFWAKVDEYSVADPRLAEMVEGLSWAMAGLANPIDLPNGRALAGTPWHYTVLGAPPSYLVLYEIDEATRKVTYTELARLMTVFR